MADLIENVIARWEKAGPLISPRQIRIWARGVASRNSQLATLLRQPVDMTAEKLVAQYYRMRGLCADTGIPMLHSSESTTLAIELDHIKQVDRRKSLEAAFAGGTQNVNAGLAASMENVRLVCRIAHRMRHQAEIQGVDFSTLCSMWSRVATSGCAIDPSIEVNHQSSNVVQAKAEELIDGLLCDSQRFWSLETVCSMLQENHLPLTYDEVRKLMIKKVGTNLSTYRTNFRASVVRDVIMSDNSLSLELTTKGCTDKILDTINERCVDAGMAPVTKMGMKPYLKKLGIGSPSSLTQTGRPRKKTAVNSSCRSSLWAFAKSAGIKGFSAVEVRQRFPSWDEALVSVAISDAVERKLIEDKRGMLFGRFNRKEAARILDLSPQVLKKYAVMGKAPPHLLGRPGVGVEAMYSLEDLLEWRRLHPAQNRVTRIKQIQMSGI
jgi:hypothetical protein